MRVASVNQLYAHETFMETVSHLLAAKADRELHLNLEQNEYPVKEDKDDMDVLFGAMIY